ncbi:outer membrane beta-barrel protein [Hydrogenophaga sp. 5NK40-0174]|uniref:outer membrane beta-barrel protein n=1 Tax=Hydrogenophaga sp. 5NK40-0174 TaxID=3127649 RepID=UPI0031050999
MNLKQSAFALSVIGSAVFSMQAHAGMVKDSHGNVGYDTAAECDAAVIDGSAKFYEPSTKMPPKRRKGEVKVVPGKLSDLGPDYERGACDLGVARGMGRNGVAKALQGKYVPYSPDMPVNKYLNKDGETVRVSMRFCDNRFSEDKPRPVPAPAPKAAPAPAAAPAAPAPAAAAPAPVEPKAAPRKNMYVFGTAGSVFDSVRYDGALAGHDINDKDNKIGAQFGFGYQFNDMWGGEVFYQGGKRLEYTAANDYVASMGTRIFGLRATVGKQLSDAARVFGKAGLANVNHHNSSGRSTHWTQQNGLIEYDESKVRPTLGVGFTYDLNSSLALRADLDHYFKTGSANPNWKDATYVGVGLQFSF